MGGGYPAVTLKSSMKIAIPLVLFFIKYHPAQVEMDWLQEPAELWNGNSVADDETVTS